MPKENIDYSNTIIYKIYCNDDTITDIYVGHTTHFIQRKYQHKLLCNESKNVLKIYKTIRENGGWDNWSMVEIAIYNCKNSTEARIKEQIHYEELHASLNSCAPYIDKTKYFCVECDLQCKGPKIFNNHINCISHNKMKNNKLQQISFVYDCKKCDYQCSHKGDWNKHIHTSKHVNDNNGSSSIPKTPLLYKCHCGNEYNHMSGLSRHRKNCNNTQIIEHPINVINQQQLIDYLMKENSEFKQLIMEQNKHMFELVKNAGNNNNMYYNL